MNELDVVRDVSRRLEEAGVAFMLTGSMAMNYYATPRMTRDIDLVVALELVSVAILESLFVPDYYLSVEAARQAVRQASMFNLIHQESVIKVDFIVRKQSPYRQQEFVRRQRVRVGDFATWIVSKEDLVLSKLVWAAPSHSELQLRDVRSLLATGVDRAYLDQWADELGVRELLAECTP